MDQNIDFSGSDQIQTPQYPDVHPSKISNEVFQANHSIQNEKTLENSSDEIVVSNPNQEKEEPPQESDIRQLVKEECYVEASEEQKQSMEVKNVVEQPAECGNRSIQSLQNFRVVHKSPISFKNTSQISSIHTVAPILSTKEPEHLLSMRYEHLSITPETESDEVTESNAENLLPIPSEYEVTLEDKKEYIEYVEDLLSDPEIISVEEENVVHQAENDVNQEKEEFDLEDISQIQDVVLREKLLGITRLISNIKSLNDNPNPDHVLNSFESDNSLSDNFSPEFETFCEHSEETRSGNTTHADNPIPEYDSFCFEIEPDQERLINLVKNNIPDDSSNDSLLVEADLFLASDNSIPPGIENFADDPEGDIRFLEELLIDDSILSHELSDCNFEDNPLIPRPPPEPPDAKTDIEEGIPVVMINKDKFDEDYHFFMFDKVFSFLSAESEETIFDPDLFESPIEIVISKRSLRTIKFKDRVELTTRSLVDKIICDLNKAPDSPHLYTFSFNQRHCFHCKDVLEDGEFYQRCTCTRCGSGFSKGLCLICGYNHNSLNDSPSIFENSSQSPPQINHHCCYGCGDPLEVPIIPNPEHFNNQTIKELPPTFPSFDSKSDLVHDYPNVFDPPPQLPFISCEFCRNDARYGHYCTLQVLFVYPEPCYNQDFNFSLEFQEFHDFQQQDLCCENCGVAHEAYQCQPKIEDYYHDQFIQKKEEEKQIEENQAANARYWKILACYDDDDDDYAFAITPNEPVNSLSMGDEHLDIISATKSDEFIKSSVENLVSIPSESEGESECEMPACEEFTTLSNILFDSDYDFSSSDDQSFYDEDVPKKIYLNPLFEEEIIPMKINQHHYNAETDHIESLHTHDSSIIISSKIDSFFNEFAGELTLLKSISPRIDETDCYPKEETHLIKRLLYDNSSPRPPKEFISENSDATIKSFFPSPILVKDSDSLMEEIDLSFTPDYPMPPGIEEDDYDSEMDILISEDLLSNDSLSLPENESFHFDIPSFSRPPAKPPDGNTGILNVKMMGDISEQKVPMPGLMITFVLNQEKSPDLLSHQVLEAFQPSAECPMMIHGKNTPILDVPLFHFYPP
uniref:Pre-mRNA splicing Prp18-interacting factor n=1 Tax=Tanacetum cinerariifolium TaxID=118510 RepID=A0A699GK02_TANCI|nr:hypothetical protein [Tanacetum cinerariifolium]